MSVVGQSERFDPNLYNKDLAPIPKARRDWSWINYSTVWMGMVHNVVAYTTAALLVQQGMSPWQALGAVTVANVVLILAMVANSIAGSKYGLPFPVLLWASFGRHRALVPVAGILLADFYLVRRRNYDLESFYVTDGDYEYSRGWNLRAIAATALGLVVAFVGVYAPLVGLESFSILAGYTWFLGLAVSFFAYAFLMRSVWARNADSAESALKVAPELS